MSKTYRIHGARYLRKYTAPEKSSIYSYMADVRRIANTLCTVPWERVKRDIAATTTIHTEEGLDWNVEERERFDAAEWCGEHSDGFHRAFAQAACYVFKLPASAIGTAVEKIAVQVTGDPYNPYGARISAMTSATLDIPMDCATVRTGEMFRAPDAEGMGAAPRLFVRNADGTQNWYANTERVELSPGEGQSVTLKQYLFVFCVLENYNRGRDGWIEGSSYIDNDVGLTLAAECADLDEDELNDLAPQGARRTLAVLRGGVLPHVPPGAPTGARAVTVRADADTLVEDDGSQADVRDAAGARAASAVGRLYAQFYAGAGDAPTAGAAARQAGAFFRVERRREPHVMPGADFPVEADVLAIESAALVVPFALPRGFEPTAVRLDFSAPSLTSGARFGVYLAAGKYLTSLTAEQVAAPGLYDGDGAPFDLLGTVEGGTSATFALPEKAGRVGTLVVTGWLPPEAVDLAAQGPQGTGAAAFVPDVTVVE